MILSSVLLFGVGGVGLLLLSSAQNKKLVQYEFGTILRGNGDLLRLGNVREFAEKIGLKETDYYLSVESNVRKMNFAVGEVGLLGFGQCTAQAYLEYNLRYCRQNPIPSTTLLIVSCLFFLLVLTTGLMLRKLSSEMVVSFKGIFDLAAIEYPDQLSFARAWLMAKNMAHQFQASQAKMLVAEQYRARSELAQQVAHDIRSPVAALRLVVSQIKGLTEPQVAILRASTTRIQAIANDLLQRQKDIPLTASVVVETIPLVEFGDIVNEIVLEKSILAISNLTFQVEMGALRSCAGDRVRATGVELGRIVSNLLNNAIEARNRDYPVIRVEAVLCEDGLRFLIGDNGKGIPPEILPTLWQAGHSFEKPEGSGLGMHHCKVKVESWGGTCEIRSEIGVGTEVILNLCLVHAEAV